MSQVEIIHTDKGPRRVLFGLIVLPHADELTTAKWAFANYEEALALGCSSTRAELFWWIVDYHWGPKSGAKKKFVRHPWAERMTDLACEHPYLAVSGSGSCVRGDTRILNPITGETPTIRELCDNRIMPTVMTTEGPTLATVPFLKGREELFLVELQNGSSFVSTASHLVLTERGFVPVSSLRCGQSISGYDPSPFQSTLDIGQPVQSRGELNYPKTTEGSQGNCSVYSCHDGVQLLPEEDNVQSFSPLPTCAQECMEYVSFHEGGRDNKLDDIHLYQCVSHLSNAEISLSSSQKQGIHGSPQRFEGTSLRKSLLNQLLLPFALMKRLLNSFSEAIHGFWHILNGIFQTNQIQRQDVLDTSLLSFDPRRSLSQSVQFDILTSPFPVSFQSESHTDHVCLPNPLLVPYVKTIVSPVAVSRITSVGEDYFYDLQVPGPNHYFAEGAIHHNSGKSDWGAMWALVNWISAPDKTKVLVTSTTMKDAQKRIWGSVRAYYYGSAHKLPGKYVHSFGQIRTNVMASDDTGSDKCGVELIPCAQSKEAQAIGRMIGIKADLRLVVIADELPELTEAILEACRVNLSMNPNFQMVGLGNHGSWLDPFGQFCTPKAGITSVTVEDEEWETELGWCLHLDGTKSPNFDQDKDVWPIYGRKQQREHSKLPSNSIGFWRFCRSFPPQDSEANQIYSEIEIISNGCVSAPHWKGPIIRLAGLDPAFTTGGDACRAIQGILGETVDGTTCLAVSLSEQFHVDVTSKVPTNFQYARLYIEWCKRAGILPENAGTDATGAGVPFADILSQEWSPRINRIAFGGSASNLPASLTEGTTGEDEYVNRVSELWYQGVHYVRGQQIKSLPRSLVKELVERRYKHVKGARIRIQVETKEEFKKRLKRSPDESDAFFVMLEVARQRHGFMPLAFGAALKEEIANQDDKIHSGFNVLESEDCLLDYANA